MTDKVISFPGAPSELPENPIELTTSGKPFNYCQHERISLDAHKRLVDCRDCGQVLDPYDFLEKNAATLARAWRSHAAVTLKVAELNESIRILQKELESVKGKLRRAKDQLPVIDVRGKDKL